MDDLIPDPDSGLMPRSRATARIIRMREWGYLCPHCRDAVLYDRKISRYFCEACGFGERKAQYAKTLRAIRATLTSKGEPVQIVDQERELARLKSIRAGVAGVETVVYYVRFRDVVKIGTSVDVKSRLASLPWEEVLAMEPGGRVVEQHRHKQFKADRFMDEWFHQSDALSAHIRAVRFNNLKWREERFPGLPEFPWAAGSVVITKTAAVTHVR